MSGVASVPIRHEKEFIMLLSVDDVSSRQLNLWYLDDVKKRRMGWITG
jgi:hypothetical protein